MCWTVVASLALPALADPATGWKQTGAGPYDYNDAANWVDGDINGIFGSDLTLTANQTITFDADTTLPNGLTFQYAGAYSITMTSDGSAARTLTLGGDLTFALGTNNDKIGVTIGSGTVAWALNIDLGGEKRSILAGGQTKPAFKLLNAISNGGLELHNTYPLTLNSANTYAAGTTLAGTGAVTVMRNAFGTGTITFEQGSLLSVTGNRAFTANNPLVFNGDWRAALSGGNLNLGEGDISIPAPVTVTADSKTLTLGGTVVQGTIADITKAGSGVLATYADYATAGEAAFACTAGTWEFHGTVSAASLATAGAGVFALHSTGNSFSPDIRVASGTAFQPAVAGALPDGATILLEDGATIVTSDAYPAGTLAAMLDPASTGTLALHANYSGDIDLSGTAGVGLATYGANRTLSGTVTWPDVNPLRLGGGGDILTFSGANAVPSGRDIEFFGKVQFNSENDIDGTLIVRNGGLLILDGAAGALPNAKVIVEQGGELRFTSSVACDVIRATDVTLKAGTLNFNGNKDQPVKHRISRLTLTTMPGAGGTPQMTWSTKDSKQTTLYIDEILRPTFAMLNVSGGSPGLTAFESGWNIVVSSGVENTSEGMIGTTTAPFVPWMRNGATTLVYNDPEKGLRFHTSDERQTYSANYEAGGPVVSGENMLINVSGTVMFTDSMATVATFCFGAKENQYLKMSEGGVLKVTSGTFGCTYNKVYPQVTIDLNGKHGYVLGISNRAPRLQGSVGGTTQGLTIANESADKGNYIEVGAAGTYSGDVHIHGAIWNQSATFFPAGVARPGNVYVEGWWRCGNASPTINGLYGSGLVEMNNNYNQTITMGSDGSGGDYNGRVVRSGGVLALTKIGAGRQRLGGECNYNGATRIEGGTLQIDGANSNSAFTVLDGAALAGCGSITKAVTLQSGAALALGSAELPEDHQMDFGTSLAFASGSSLSSTFDVRSDRACAAIVAGNITGDGVTVPVSVSGEGPGRWLLLEAASIQPEFALAQGVSGHLETVTAENTTQIWYTRADTTTIVLIQ